MKMFKRIFSAICSLAIVASMAVGVQAATIENPMSLAITDNGDNTVTVDIKTSLDEISGVVACVKVPEALKAYITEWTYTTEVPTSKLQPISVATAYEVGSCTSASYIRTALTSVDGSAFAVPANDVLISLKITLNGEVPEDVDRTLTLGGEFKSNTKRKGASTISVPGTAYYLKTADTQGTPANTFDFDPTAAGNYVVVPAAAPVVTGPAYDGYVGDTDAEDVAVGASYEFTAPEAGATGIKWTVETTEGVKKTHVSTVDVAGGATYTLGLVIQGLAETAVASIAAVLQ